MTDKTITNLTAAGSVDGTELLAIVQGGNSRKLTTLLLAGAILGGTVLPGITWDQTNRALVIATIANPAASALSITSGAITGTTSFPALNIAATFNNSGLTGTVFKLNLTDTSSNAASLLMDLQTAAVSQWKVSKSGVAALTGSLAIGGATIGTNALAVTGTGNISGVLTVGSGAGAKLQLGSTSQFITALGSNVEIGSFGSTGLSIYGDLLGFQVAGAGNNPDTVLRRDAANTLAQRNTTNAQRNKMFNTWTDASNGEWFEVDWITNANTATIGTNKNGTGTTRNLRINIGGTNQLDYGVTNAGVWTAASQVYGPTLRTNQTTVANLPNAGTAGAGAMAFVTDANATFILGLGLAAVGGGANKVPVYSDGSSWIVG